jgi:iron complex outermembrane receptor protein
MNYLPSVVTTSDAGNGVGYTGIRVRGSDATRVNVTINGIPYITIQKVTVPIGSTCQILLPPESVQLQRGVGTSTNGSGAFGASLNMLTDSYAKESNGKFRILSEVLILKHTVKFSTGLMDDHFELAGRLSALKSDILIVQVLI